MFSFFMTWFGIVGIIASFIGENDITLLVAGSFCLLVGVVISHFENRE